MEDLTIRRKACEECRRKKKRCDMTTASRCTNCISLGLSCSVTEYRRYRKTQLSRRIGNLEENINRLETAVRDKLAAVHGVDLPTAPSLLSSRPEPPTFYIDVEHTSEPSRSCNGADWSHCAPLGQKVEFGNRFFENLSPPPFPRCLMDPPADCPSEAAWLRPLSTKGKNWMAEKLGDNLLLPSIAPTLSAYAPRQNHGSGIFGDSFLQQFFTPLPNKYDMKKLFQSFLDNFNNLCSLFAPASLLSLVNEDFSNPLSKVDHWACANVALALGHMFSCKPSEKAEISYHQQRGCMFVKNALYVVNELSVGPPTLWAAQALAGITIFLLGTLNEKPCDFLAASALRISYELATEKPEYHSAGWTEELKQRGLVFWLAYCLDRDICLRFGGPLGQSNEFMDLESFPLPENATGTSFNVLKSYCELSVIKGQVHKHLYSATSAQKPLSDIANVIMMLDEKLSKWKHSVPKEYKPDVQTAPRFPQSLLAVAVLNLHFSYFSCLIAIHRVALPQTLEVNIKLAQSYSYRLLSGSVPLNSETLLQHAARASIRLIEFLPKHYIFLVVLLLHYLLVASTTLSCSISQNPHVATRGWDMQLVGKVERFLSSLVLTETDEGGLKQLIKRCAEFRALAETAVHKSE